MAAALRNTARTLRALQQTQAAATSTVVRCRPLSRMLVHGGPSHVSSARRLASSSGAYDIDAYDGMVNEKKKELYHLLGEMHRSKSYMLSFPNRMVLYQLSKQFDEDEWRWHRRARSLKIFVLYALMFNNGYRSGQAEVEKDRLKSSTNAR